MTTTPHNHMPAIYLDEKIGKLHDAWQRIDRRGIVDLRVDRTREDLAAIRMNAQCVIDEIDNWVDVR